jgi:rare lipoprotein A
MKSLLLYVLCLFASSPGGIGRAEPRAERGTAPGPEAEPVVTGIASWYGEEHRGKLMANGKRFDPEKLTAASWFFPLETKVLVTLNSTAAPPRSVVVTITDRGPAHRLVRAGRILDLSYAAFQKLAPPEEGLVEVTVQAVRGRDPSADG